MSIGVTELLRFISCVPLLPISIVYQLVARHTHFSLLICVKTFSLFLSLSLSLLGANQEAIAVAHSSGAQFIRAEGYVFSQVSDEGWMDSCAGELLRYRRMIGADNVLIFTDIKKKHR